MSAVDHELDRELAQQRQSASSRERVRLDINNSTQLRLYGRGKELQTLGDLQRQVVTDKAPSSVAFIHGTSGSGKTALVEKALSAMSTANADMFIAKGKCDQFTGPSSPYAAIIEAFDKLGQTINETGQYSEDMKAALALEGGILCKFIPSFYMYEPATDDEAEIFSLDTTLVLASERLAVAFVSFLRRLCTNVRPLCFFMDDLHWADQRSQELIAAILNDGAITNLLFIGGYRDDDPTMIQPLLERIKQPRVTDILLDNMQLESVNSLLADILLQPDEKVTEELATVVYRKTNGNPYFVLQQLEQLQAQHLVVYRFSSVGWEWDMAAVHAGTDLSENVVEVVNGRINGLTARTRRILMLASCLGYSVDVELLESLELLDLIKETEEESPEEQANGESTSFATEVHSALRGASEKRRQATLHAQLFQLALDEAEEEGFIQRSGSTIRFTHDRVYGHIYELVEMTKTRDLLHYRIGQYLQSIYEETAEVRFLFLAVEQLNRSSSLLEKDEDIISLIKLNYEASLLAKEKAGIENVSILLGNAYKLVKPSFWRFYYELILDIYTSAAEVEFSLGRLEVSKQLIDVIMENAVREIDTVRALVVKFQTYGVQRQFKKAIEQARIILKLLGEPLPRTSLLNVTIEYFKAKRDARNKSDRFFTELAQTQSKNVKIVLKVLQIGSVYGWNSDTTFAGLAFLRAIRITIREGSCESTPWIYSGYGFMLALFGDEKEGFRFGQLARDKSMGKETFPSSCTLTYMCLLHLQLPMSIGIEPLLLGYRVGLVTGDVFFGSTNLSCYALVYLCCGLPLSPLAQDMMNYGGQLKICHQDIPLAFMMPTCQLALNLMGKSDDHLELTRDSIKRNQSELFNENILNSEDDASVLYMCYLQVFNAYILDAEDLVESTLKRISRLKEQRFGGTHIMNYFCNFVDGLAGLYLVRKRKSPRFGKKLARNATSVLRKWSKSRPANSVSMLSLLEAEKVSRKLSTSGAKKKYDDAISQFARSGYMHYTAISNELAGNFMLEKGDMYWAEYYLSRACSLYREWNAEVKVKLMTEMYGFIQTSDLRGGALQGKSRFDLVHDSVVGLQSPSVDFSSGNMEK